MITEGDTPERMKQESAFVLEANALAREYIESASTWQQALSSLFVARALQALMSVEILAGRGAIGDAMSVARTVVELEIEHAYIMQNDTVRRWERYVTYEVVSRDKLVQAMGVLHGAKANQQALAHSRREALVAKNRLGSLKKRKQKRQGNQVSAPEASLKDRAYATGRNKDYDLAYTDMCGASHGGFSTLWYVTEPTDKLPIKILVGFGKPAVKPVALALKSMLQLLETATTDAMANTLKPKTSDLIKRVLAAVDSRSKTTNG